MKRGIIILILISLILPTILAETPSPMTPVELDIPSASHLSPTNQPKPTTNAWNETIIISETWQTLIGTFFGLNLKKVSTAITVREAIVLFSIFIMFLVIILDILKLTPFFKIKLGPISGEFLAALVVTILVSISGSFINLKDLFIQAVIYTVTSLDWQWLNYLTQNKVPGILITILIIIPALIIIHELLSIIKPILEKYSKVSRAEAGGRAINNSKENVN